MDTQLVIDKQWLEQAEDRRLAPYAMRSAWAGRTHPVDEEKRDFVYRTEFQRDRDRIIHSRAFRRLQHKTQVFIPFEGDHFRNRLTHTLEVAQISRTMARALNLNEDLTEAIALGHDLGHTPFGHSGENILNEILSGQVEVDNTEADLLKNAGGFKHNFQSIRVVDLIETRYSHAGINLTNPTREGIFKHTRSGGDIEYPEFRWEGIERGRVPHFEAQVVALADEIAQQAHDLEDGLRAGEVDFGAVERLKISREVIGRLGTSYSAMGQRYRRQNTLIRGLIHLLVTNVILASWDRLNSWSEEQGLGKQQDLRRKLDRLPAGAVDFDHRGRILFDNLKEFIYRYIINSFYVNRSDGRARHFVTALFRSYYTNPRQLDSYVLLRYRDMIGRPYLRDFGLEEVNEEIRRNYHNSPAFVRLVADHIAGMTDKYALDEYERLYSPYPRELGRR